MQRALNAFQPTNVLHIGNYFGALLPIVEAERNHETFLMIADYHAITVPQEPEKLRDGILFATAAMLAAGVNPKKTVLFQQSMVPEHTELAWILNGVAHMGELERMTQYKDKSRKQKAASVGLFDYPVLMAADILLYDTNVVPVGEDQKQHVELTRDLAGRFNKQFGDTFVIPNPEIRKVGARLMSLDDPKVKMSKSGAPKSYLSLMDEPAVIRKKIMAAVTDSGDGIAFDPKRPAISNLVTIFSLITTKSFEQINIDYAGSGYGDFKKDLAEALVLYLTPLQAEIKGYLNNKDTLHDILNDGAERAKALAKKKMEAVREKIGVS